MIWDTIAVTKDKSNLVFQFLENNCHLRVIHSLTSEDLAADIVEQPKVHVDAVRRTRTPRARFGLHLPHFFTTLIMECGRAPAATSDETERYTLKQEVIICLNR